MSATGERDENVLRKTLALLEDNRSPFLQAVEQWAMAHCEHFGKVVPRASSSDPVREMPQWCHDVHQEYVKFVESELEDCMQSEPGGAAALLAAARGRTDKLGDEVARTFEALCSFDIFLQLMEDARKGLGFESVNMGK